MLPKTDPSSTGSRWFGWLNNACLGYFDANRHRSIIPLGTRHRRKARLVSRGSTLTNGYWFCRVYAIVDAKAVGKEKMVTLLIGQMNRPNE